MIRTSCVSLKTKNYRPILSRRRFPNVFDLTSQCGVWSKNDLDYFYKKKEELSKLSDNDAKQIYTSLLQNINNIASKYLKNISGFGKFLYYDKKEFLPQKLLKEIKEELLKFKIVSNFESINAPSTVNLPYINRDYKAENQNKKILMYNSHDNILSHPRDILKSIIKDTKPYSCAKFYQMFSNKNLSELIHLKNKILEEISLYTNKNSQTYDFIFSKEELKKLSHLAAKYDSIQNLFEQNGIHTKEIETLLFSQTKLNEQPTELHNNIPLTFTQIYDKKKKTKIPAIITFANTDIGYRFKIYQYDKNLFLNIQNTKKQYMHFARTGNIKNINAMNSKISDYTNNSEIGEVFVEISNKADLKQKMLDNNLMNSETIDETLGDDNLFYYLKNLKNYNVNRFFNVAQPLISTLKEFGKNNKVHKVFLEALAFNNVKHSPLALYLKAGCIPISENVKDLEKEIHRGFDYKKGVWLMYKL